MADFLFPLSALVYAARHSVYYRSITSLAICSHVVIIYNYSSRKSETANSVSVKFNNTGNNYSSISGILNLILFLIIGHIYI